MASPLRQRGRRLKHKYGLSEKDFLVMFLMQRGLCAVCGLPETATDATGKVRALSVDHNHATGAVRSLLCNACNRALGYLNEDPKRIRALADYIEDHTPHE